MSDVTRLNTESPIKQALRLEKKVRHVNEVKRGLRGLTLLLDGHVQNEIDPMYVLGLLDPLEEKLREAAEELDAGYYQLVKALRGDQDWSGLNDLRLCQLAGEHRRLDDRAPDLKEAVDRQEAIATEMLDLPADSLIGAAAKLVAARVQGEDEPAELYPKVQHRALDEIERFAGFTPQQQAAE